MPGNWYKNNPDDKIWWLDNSETKGEWLFSFDKEHTFNMFADYPHNLTAGGFPSMLGAYLMNLRIV